MVNYEPVRRNPEAREKRRSGGRLAPLRSALLLATVLLGLHAPQLSAQQPSPLFQFEGDADVASKYLWRGQRLTNDWSLQPGMTVIFDRFSFNVWGNLDLTAVNEGDALLLPQNPMAPPGAAGLRGKFSEVDFTFSFLQPLANGVALELGSIVYTFPERSVALPSTVEIYGGIHLEKLPLAPSATFYVDVDESRKEGGSSLYFNVAAERSLSLPYRRVTELNVAGWLSVVNGRFGSFYYGESLSGLHDFNLTVSLPVQIREHGSFTPFVAYSALLRGFRDHQLQDPRALYLGTAGSPATFADTVWGGVRWNLSF